MESVEEANYIGWIDDAVTTREAFLGANTYPYFFSSGVFLFPSGLLLGRVKKDKRPPLLLWAVIVDFCVFWCLCFRSCWAGEWTDGWTGGFYPALRRNTMQGMQGTIWRWILIELNWKHEERPSVWLAGWTGQGVLDTQSVDIFLHSKPHCTDSEFLYWVSSFFG